LDSVLKDGLLSFADGVCGGLLLTKDAKDYAVSGGIAAAFSDSYIYFYDLSSCAMFRRLYSPSENALYALSPKFICKADGNGRYVTRISDGIPLYFDNETSTTGVYSSLSGCYFLQSDGGIDYFDEYMRRHSETESGLTSVRVTETGFSAFLNDIYVKITLSEGMLAEYEQADGVCVNSLGAGELICGADELGDPLAAALLTAEKLASTQKEYLILSGGTLKAYEKIPSWERSVYTSFTLPLGCLYNGDLIFSDYFSKLRKLNPDGTLSALSEIPDECDYSAVRYVDGIFYYANKSFRFAKSIKTGGNTMHKSEADGMIIYRASD
jgi:hypothetical protein